METTKVRLFAEDDPIFSTSSAHLLPKSVREYMEARKSGQQSPPPSGQKYKRHRKKSF